MSVDTIDDQFEAARKRDNLAYWEQAKAKIQELNSPDTFYRGAMLEIFDSFSARIATWNDAQGFWQSENHGEKFMLMVTELGEAMEGHRKPGPSDKIPAFTQVEEELADCLIRILDYSGHFNLRLGLAFLAKLEYNLSRPYKHGKSC